MSGVGLTAPKLLPIAGTWAAPFAVYYVILTSRIVAQRIKTQQFIGNRLRSTASDSQFDPLEIAARCQGNFIENVPLAFVFLAIAELNGGNKKALNYIMAALFALRLAHAEFGLRLKGNFGGGGVGRPIGYFGTSGILLGLGGYTTYLVKSYWGF